MTLVRKAVIPVAGFGTRFLPATKIQPKEMLPVVDKPVIQYIVEEFVEAGIEQIVLVTSANKRAIEDHFDINFELEEHLKKLGKKELLKEVRRVVRLAKFIFVRQLEVLGNGHALLQAKEVIGDEPFAFTYGDDLIDAKIPAIKQVMQTFKKYTSTTIGVMEVDDEGTKRYGIIDPIPVEKNVFKVKRTIEKPGPARAPSHLANPGRYLFTPEIFAELEKVQPGHGGEIWVADAVERLSKRRSIYAHQIIGTYFDCGNKIEFLKAIVHFGLQHPEVNGEFRKYLSQFCLKHTV